MRWFNPNTNASGCAEPLTPRIVTSPFSSGDEGSGSVGGGNGRVGLKQPATVVAATTANNTVNHARLNIGRHIVAHCFAKGQPIVVLNSSTPESMGRLSQLVDRAVLVGAQSYAVGRHEHGRPYCERYPKVWGAVVPTRLICFTHTLENPNNHVVDYLQKISYKD